MLECQLVWPRGETATAPLGSWGQQPPHVWRTAFLWHSSQTVHALHSFLQRSLHLGVGDVDVPFGLSIPQSPILRTAESLQPPRPTAPHASETLGDN